MNEHCIPKRHRVWIDAIGPEQDQSTAESRPSRTARQVILFICALLLSCISATVPAAMFGSIDKREEPGDLDPERWTGALYGHEKMYIAAGGGEDFDARFQLSLKARLWDHLFVGYTQTSVWDLYKESKPFRDSSYRPSVFYHTRDVLHGKAWTLNLSGGYEHESNGRAGPDSRSINIVFLRPTVVLGQPTECHWQLGAKLYAYLSKEENNHDIQKYRGFGDYYAVYGRPDNWELSVTARKGTSTNFASMLVEAAVPMKTFVENFQGDLFIQYFWGYGETILDYNLKGNPQIRIGYQVWRER